jgi:hypothetical protein
VEYYVAVPRDLELGRAFQFRYLRDGEVWLNDNQADAYVPNPYGSDNLWRNSAALLSLRTQTLNLL